MGALQTAFEAPMAMSLRRGPDDLRGMAFANPTSAGPSRSCRGWRMRVALARLLMEQPTPSSRRTTNHDLRACSGSRLSTDWPGSRPHKATTVLPEPHGTHIVELDRGPSTSTRGLRPLRVEKRQRYEALANAAKNQQRESSRPRASSSGSVRRTPRPSRCNRRSVSWRR